MKRSSYEILEVKNGIAYIQDLDGAVSVTNDAENVYSEIQRLRVPVILPRQRVVYRDTYGEWAEMIMIADDHPGDWRIAFKPWHGLVWDILTK